MNKNTFDVLVVYSEEIARSASSLKAELPFPKSTYKQYNLAYAYFLEVCKINKLNAAFTTTKDIIGAGTCNSYWIFKNKKWTKINKNANSTLIFNKFSPINPKYISIYKTLFGTNNIKPFNDNFLHHLFDDKQLTFDTLSSCSIPTVSLNSFNNKTINKSINALSKLSLAHIQNKDFSKSIILKDKHGAGGEYIFKIDNDFLNNIRKISDNNKGVSFVLQPFVLFEKGYTHNNLSKATDIRLIYQKNKIIQAFIRTAASNDFRCNEHQGGTVEYISIANIPPAIIKLSKQILIKLNRKKAFFALDFIISDAGNIYFLEGNINPGIYWGANSDSDKTNTKKLIYYIVKNLSEINLIQTKQKKKLLISKEINLNEILPILKLPSINLA